jgi:hypothetical protein
MSKEHVMRASTLFVLTSLALFAGAFSSSPLSAQPIINPQQAWGPASDGMRMAISAVAPGATTQHDSEVYIAFQNLGSKEAVLNLGYIVAQDIHEPAAIRLALTDPKGETREFWCSRTRAIAGRMDHYLVTLPAGATHVLRLRLEEYCCSEPRVALGAGQYRIAARFEGKGPQRDLMNGDGPRMAYLNFWMGVLQSNTAEFEIAK